MLGAALEPARTQYRPLPRAFAHPAWWGALALLLLNDHVWKGGGVLPAVLTGKLSDFAGMMVAPPLVALVLGTHSRTRRVVAVACTGAGFALIKCVPTAAAALGQLLALLQLPSRIWVDPSDLFALALLPVGHALCQPLPARSGLVALRWLQRAGVLLGALTCMATFGGEDKKSGSSNAPEIENASDGTLSVVLASTEAAGGCSLYRDDRVALLNASAFIAPREVELEADQRAALAADADNAECGAASIQLPDGTSVLVFWRDLETIESFAPADDARRDARRVVITGDEGHYDVDIGDDLTVFQLGEGDVPAPTCEAPEPTASLEFTALATAQGFFEVGEIRTADDGCLEVDWFALEADTSPDTQRLCIPDWAFPFEVGEQLSVVQEFDPLGARSLRITRHSGDKLDTQLAIWNDAAELEDSRVKRIEPVDCVGELAACGAYLRAVELDVRGQDAPLVPGDDATIDGSDPKETRILIGPARDVAWSAPTCSGAEARVGATANVLELRTY
jgi:hypothetical protein